MEINKLNVCVCGCTINSSSYIKEHLQHLIDLKNIFHSVDIVIYENDSTDNTVEILKKLEDDKKITLISEENIKSTFKARTEIIAHGRNKLVQYVRSQEKYDYMIMVDLDGVLKNPITNSIKSAFSYDPTKWDVLVGNCLDRYYDIWALRINQRQWTPIHNKIWDKCLDYDSWDMYTHRKQEGRDGGRLRLLHIKRYQKNIPTNFPLIAIESGFNGIGIYKISCIKDCNYEGITKYCTCRKYNVIGRCMIPTPEHVQFHKEIREKNSGRIFICPSLIVNDHKEHWH